LFFAVLDDWFVLYLLLVMAFLLTPFGAFGSIAAIVFAIGWYLRWPACVARRRPWVRGTAVLTIVFVLHGLWFQYGWVYFWPPCLGRTGSVLESSHRSLVGPMTPEAAIAFAKTLDVRDRGVAHVSDENFVIARPAMALFDDEGVWNNTSKIAERLAEEQGLPAPDFDRSNECEVAERVVMVGGRAQAHASGWGTWPWNTFEDDGAVVEWLRDQAD
jgi:hypothetical protein